MMTGGAPSAMPLWRPARHPQEVCASRIFLFSFDTILTMHSGCAVLTEQGAKTLSELNRLRAVKDKLETLCRELQKQNRFITTSEQQKREALTDKFQSSISVSPTPCRLPRAL
jgi:hypothetical protein